MNRLRLGRSGLEVSELSFGTLILGRLQAGLTPEQAAPAIQKAVELGINFFDTAQSYGTHEHLRVGLGRASDRVIIATKTHARTRQDAQAAFETALGELGRDYIDVYLFHLIHDGPDLERRRPVLDYLLELKQQGRIRAIGASVHRVEGASAVAAAPELDVLFPVLNRYGLGIIDGTIEDMTLVVRQARSVGQGVYAMKPLAGGHLRTAPGEAFKYLRDRKLADSICAGMKSPAEVEMNVRLFEGREIPEDLRRAVETVPRMLKIYDRCVGCGSCVEACDQGALSLDESQADLSRGKKGQSVVDRSKCILCGYCAEVCPEFTIRVV